MAYPSSQPQASGDHANVVQIHSYLQSQPQASGDHANVVASHYNQLGESGLHERTLSRIFYLRNFNNWTKSVLIGDTLEKLRRDKDDRSIKINVLDLCSGKGGDLLKWAKGKINSLVCADIAATSVEQSESRYKQSAERGRNHNNTYDAEFITADCTKELLNQKYKQPNRLFHVVSCQFSFHYCFESYPQAMVMLKNAAENLTPGGYFIGTTPDANEIVRRLKKADGNSFGNEVYNITFPSENKDHFPLFGAQYNFHLEGVVDCPEFLVYFPVLEKLAEQFGLKLIEKKSFADFFKENVGKKEHFHLLSNMQALEAFPPPHGTKPVSSAEGDYTVAEGFMSKLKEGRSSDSDRRLSIGTLSQAEWEAATLYLVFIFQKVADGPLSHHDTQFTSHTKSSPSSQMSPVTETT